jgi:hypothetical protein
MLPNSTSPPHRRARGRATTRSRWPARVVIAAALLMYPGCNAPNQPRSGSDVEASDAVIPPTPPLEAGKEQSLLHEYAAREPIPMALRRIDARRCYPSLEPNPDDPGKVVQLPGYCWRLPYRAKLIDGVLLTAIAHRDLELLHMVLTPDAQWGLPDRRMLEAKPIFGRDHGQAFIDALHATALRMPATPAWESKGTVSALEGVMTVGAEPMWSYFSHEVAPGRLDVIVIRKVTYQGQAAIDFVGLYPDGPPDTPVFTDPAHGAVPPMSPPIDMSRVQMPAPGMRPPAGPLVPRPRGAPPAEGRPTPTPTGD